MIDPNRFAAGAVPLRDQVIALAALVSASAVYDPSDLSSLWQDASATVPVTADGDPVRRMNDVSGKGHHAYAPNDSARPTFRTSGGLCWLDCDGIDDYMVPSPDLAMGAAWTHVGGWKAGDTSNRCVFGVSNSEDKGLYIAQSGVYRAYNDGSSVVNITGGGLTSPHVLRILHTSNSSCQAALNRSAGTAYDPWNATSAKLGLFSQWAQSGAGLWYGRFYGGVWTAQALGATDYATCEDWVNVLVGSVL